MEKDKQSARFTKIYFLIWGICVVIAIAVFALYKSGYRFTNGFEPVKVGSIELSSNENGLQIFLNNREKSVALTDGRYEMKSVTPGFHSVLVSKDGFWPWTKTVAVSEGSARELYAFIFPINGLKTKILPAGSVEYAEAEKKISGNRLPEPKSDKPELLPDESLAKWIETYAPARKLSSDKSAALYVEDSTIYVAWVSETDPVPHYFCEENPCKLRMPVIVSTEPIKNAEFYKDRPDVIIFSAGSAIYAVEVDREGTQNFQPIYKGNDPYFYENGGVLYIKDGNSLLRATL